MFIGFWTTTSFVQFYFLGREATHIRITFGRIEALLAFKILDFNTADFISQMEHGEQERNTSIF
jgi:hypothetical protein